MASSDQWCHEHGQPMLQCRKELRECVHTSGAMPASPVSPMGEVAIQLDQHAADLQAAGFSRREAVWIATAIAIGNPGSPPSDEAANEVQL